MINVHFQYLLNITLTGFSRPLLKDLYEHVVPTIADKWRDVGVQLLDSNLLDQRVLEVIAADHPHSVEECCKCMFEKWLSTEKKASWNQLIQTTKNIGLLYQASQLEKKLTGENCVTCYATYTHTYFYLTVWAVHSALWYIKNVAWDIANKSL